MTDSWRFVSHPKYDVSPFCCAIKTEPIETKILIKNRMKTREISERPLTIHSISHSIWFPRWLFVPSAYERCGALHCKWHFSFVGFKTRENKTKIQETQTHFCNNLKIFTNMPFPFLMLASVGHSTSIELNWIGGSLNRKRLGGRSFSHCHTWVSQWNVVFWGTDVNDDHAFQLLPQ